MSMALISGLQISSIKLNGQSPAVRFHTFSGRGYAVEFSPGLNPANWQDLPGGSVQGNGYERVVTDTNAMQTAPARFYRLRQN